MRNCISPILYVINFARAFISKEYSPDFEVLFNFYIEAIRCPRLRRPNYGEIYPSDCTRSKMLYGGRCAFSCHAGFQLQGPSIRECVDPGRWNGGNLMTRCVGSYIEFDK